MWMGSMCEPEASCISPACTDSVGISQSSPLPSSFPMVPGHQTEWCQITAQSPFALYLMGGAYCTPPSDSSAFSVPLLGIRQPVMSEEPPTPS